MAVSAKKSGPHPHGLLVWGWGLLVGAAIFGAGFALLPWWAALFLWWWPSVLVGGSISLLGMAIATGNAARAFRVGPVWTARRIWRRGTLTAQPGFRMSYGGLDDQPEDLTATTYAVRANEPAT